MKLYFNCHFLYIMLLFSHFKWIIFEMYFFQICHIFFVSLLLLSINAVSYIWFVCFLLQFRFRFAFLLWIIVWKFTGGVTFCRGGRFHIWRSIFNVLRGKFVKWIVHWSHKKIFCLDLFWLDFCNAGVCYIE